MHENVPFPLIRNKSSREGTIITVRNRQNRWNEVSLIVGNLAAAIAAKNEREEATPHTPRYARTWCRQFVVEVYWNLGPSYFRRAYRMTFNLVGIGNWVFLQPFQHFRFFPPPRLRQSLQTNPVCKIFSDILSFYLFGIIFILRFCCSDRDTFSQIAVKIDEIWI